MPDQDRAGPAVSRLLVVNDELFGVQQRPQQVAGSGHNVFRLRQVRECDSLLVLGWNAAERPKVGVTKQGVRDRPYPCHRCSDRF